MEKDFIALENYIFTHSTEPDRAAYMMASIIGVYIDVKPAAAEDFSSKEMEDINPGDLIDLLKPLGLRAIFFHDVYPENNKIEWIQYVYISKDVTTAAKLHQEFKNLWGSMDNYGQTLDESKWQSATRKIGSLLGYPDTAVEHFANNTDADIDDPDRIARMKRYRYYIHTAEHEDDEFKAYDLKINQAIAKYAPKTTAELTKDPHKRWLD